MEAREVGEGTAHTLERRRSVIAVLAVAGIVGPIFFTVVALVHSLLRPDHSLVTLPISALATGPSGWVQDVNFVICGVLFLAYPIGLHLEVRQTRWGVVGPALLVLSGAGLVLAGVFPAVDASGNLTYDSLGHTVASFITFLGTGGGFIVVSRRLAGDSSWRNLATYTLLSGIAIVVLVFAFGALAERPGAPLHPWIGLFQWVMVAVWITCTIVLCLRLMRVTSASGARRTDRQRDSLTRH
jgi:hypothetical membrane protein